VDFPLNSITGMTIDRLMDRVNVYFPNSTIEEEPDGNLIINLNHRLVGDVVTAFAEENN
jgi:hypothetical protein